MTALATVGELELHLGHPVSDPASADQALEGASGAVRAYCKWVIAPQETVTLEVTGTGTEMASLPTLYLVDLTEIRIDGVVVDSATVPYPKWTRKGQVFWQFGWPRHARLEFDVTHAYPTTPDLIRLIVLDMASRTMDMAAQRVANPEGLVLAEVGSVKRQWAGGGASAAGTSGGGAAGMSSLTERLLDQYSLAGVP